MNMHNMSASTDAITSCSEIEREKQHNNGLAELQETPLVVFVLDDSMLGFVCSKGDVIHSHPTALDFVNIQRYFTI